MTTQYTFVFQPGGTAGANVYTSFAALYTDWSAVKGSKRLIFDDTFISPCVIPSGSYDIGNAVWSGRPNASTTSGGASVQIADGATISAPCTLDIEQLDVAYEGTSAPCIACGAGQEANVNLLKGTSLTTASSSAPFLKTTTSTSSGFVQGHSANIGDGTNSVFADAGAGGALFIFAFMGTDMKPNASTGSGVRIDYDAASQPGQPQGTGGSAATQIPSDQSMALAYVTSTLGVWRTRQLATVGTDYYINAAAGDDSNDGTTSGTAWKTWAKLRQYMATLTMAATLTVHLSADTLAEDMVVDWTQQAPFGGGVVLVVDGTRTSLYTGTLASGTTAYVPGIVGSGGSYGVLKASGITDWTSVSGTDLTGKHFVMTGGTHTGCIGVIVGVNPADHSQAYYLPLVDPATLAGSYAPNSGDTFEVYTTTKFNGSLVLVGGGHRVTVSDCTINSTGLAVDVSSGGFLVTKGCQIIGTEALASGGSYWQSIGCRYDLDTYLEVSGGAFFDNYGNVHDGSFVTLTCGAGMDMTHQIVVTGGALALDGQSFVRATFDVGLSGWICALEPDCSADGFFVAIEEHSTVACYTQAIWGHLSGSPTAAIVCVSGGMLSYAGSTLRPQLTGATHLVQVGSVYFDDADLPVCRNDGSVWDQSTTDNVTTPGKAHSQVTGYRARSETAGQMVDAGMSADGSGTPGHSQHLRTYMGAQTVNSSYTTLPTVGGSIDIMADDTSRAFTGKVVARDGSGNTAAWKVEGAIKRNSGAGTTALVGVPVVTLLGADAGCAGWGAYGISVTADATSGGISVNVAAPSATVNWHAVVDSANIYH